MLLHAATELLHVASYYGAGGGFKAVTSTGGGGQDSRFRDGMQQLSIGLASELGERVALNQTVHTIAQDGKGILVRTTDWNIRAKRGIVAISPALAGRIRYSPPLPALRDGLTQCMSMGTAIKLMLIYDRPFWREEGLSGFALTDRDLPQLMYDNSPENGECGILLGFTEGFAARR